MRKDSEIDTGNEGRGVEDLALQYYKVGTDTATSRPPAFEESMTP